MLGSRYNDSKERLENRRQSFFLANPSNSNHNDPRRIRSTGTTDTGDHSTATGSASVAASVSAATANSNSNTTSRRSAAGTGVRRHSFMAKTRSLDSGIVHNTGIAAYNSMGDIPLQGANNNPQDDYGSTGGGSSNNNNSIFFQKEGPFVVGGGRSSLIRPPTRPTCAEIHIDEKPLLDVVDRIEDQVEAHVYEDLVPLEVKLALENRIFGWSHLTSNILGHVTYTAGSFLIAYFTLTQVYLFYHNHKRHGEGQEYDNTHNDTGSARSSHILDDDYWFKAIRFAVSAVCAFNTFRTIRRRRNIWFRSAYGTNEYHKDSKRRKDMVRETDRTTLLGRLMVGGNNIMQRRVQRRLSKANKMFQKRHQREQQRLKKEQDKLKEKQQQNSIPEQDELAVEASESQEQELLCSPRSLCYSPCDSFCGGDYDEAVDHNLNTTDHSHSNSDSTPPTSDDEDTIETFLNSPIGNSKLQEQLALNPATSTELRSRKRQRRRTFHTKPTTKMESIMHDQVLINPILNMPYAHGGFFGSAPFMLANPHWISILRHLMPDVYVEISRRVAYAPASRLIHWAENNPVVAAYGVSHELEFGNVSSNDNINNSINTSINTTSSPINNNINAGQGMRSTPNLEWDVFLNPDLVAQVEAVLAERDKFLSSILPMEHYSFYETHKPLGLSVEDWLDAINEAALDSSEKDNAGAKIEFTESQRQILKYYADQLEERAQEMVDKMLIAHGKLTHLIYEILGVAKRYNYSRVKRTRRTLGGGIYARQWMAVFAEALKLGLYDDNESISAMTSDNGKDESIRNVDSFMSTSLDVLAGAMCPNSTIAESVATIQSILQRRGDDTIDTEYPVGLVLDIKSRYISKRVWACAVDTLRAAGVRVVGLASFTVDEIRGISQFCSEPLMEVIFFHSAGDLQRACHEGKIRYGDKVFFNSGSLLWEGTPGVCASSRLALSLGYDPEQTKRNYRILPFGRTRKMFDSERTMSSTSSGNKSPSMDTSSSWMEGSSIELYKERYGLSIGMYSQEFAIDDKAANLIVELANENPHVYDLGLSWGGVNGITIRGIQPGRFTSTDGLWNQRYLGALWDSNLYPPPTITSPCSTPPQTPKQEKQQ